MLGGTGEFGLLKGGENPANVPLPSLGLKCMKGLLWMASYSPFALDVSRSISAVG